MHIYILFPCNLKILTCLTTLCAYLQEALVIVMKVTKSASTGKSTWRSMVPHFEKEIIIHKSYADESGVLRRKCEIQIRKDFLKKSKSHL